MWESSIDLGEIEVKSKEEFVEQVKEIRDMLASGAELKCSCPNLKCEWHGDCFNCVRIHRHYKDHIPKCMQAIMREKVKELAHMVEFSVENIPNSPGEYWDHLNRVAPPERDGDGEK